MFLFLVRGELARHLRSYRLLVLLVGGPALMVAAALMYLSEFESARLAWQNLSRTAASAANLEEMVVPRPFSSMGFLRAAAREQWSEAAVVRPHLVDVREPDVSRRSFVVAAEPLDWTTVVVLFYSLMAVALSHDAVSGEKARGTLRLVISRPVARTVLLLSKIAASLLVLVVSLGLGLIAGLLVLAVGAEHVLEPRDVAVLVLAAACFVLFLLFNVLLGTAASVSTRTPAAALQRAVAAWALLAIGVPGLVVVAGSALHPVQSEMAFQRNLAILEGSRATRLSVSSVPLSTIVNTPGLSSFEKRRRIAALEKEMWADQEAALSELERARAELRWEYLLQASAQERWIDRWSALSPYTLLRGSLNCLVVAGSCGRREFLRQVARFEPVFTSFVLAERQRRREEAREGNARALVTDDDGEEYELRALTRLDWSEVPLSGDELPRFTWRPLTAGALAGQAALHQLWMLLFVAATGASTIWRFQVYDCR